MKYLILIYLTLLSISTAFANNYRALIVVIDLAEKATKHKRMYINETKKAVKKIENIALGHYSKTIILHRHEATKSLFLQNLENLANDSSINTIDTIVYVHGKNETYKNGPSLCFVDGEDCINIRELADEIIKIPNLNNKLRAVYSDACWGTTHMEAWLEAGYKIVSGSRGVDSNRSIDLKRFLQKWTRGRNFGESIDHANGAIMSDIMDAVIKNGNSHKDILGNSKITINSDLFN